MTFPTVYRAGKDTSSGHHMALYQALLNTDSNPTSNILHCTYCAA